MSNMRTYQVSGMTCGHCKAAVEEEVSGIDGVDAVLADVATGTLVVTGDIDPDRISAAVQEAGYEVVAS